MLFILTASNYRCGFFSSLLCRHKMPTLIAIASILRQFPGTLTPYWRKYAAVVCVPAYLCSGNRDLQDYLYCRHKHASRIALLHTCINFLIFKAIPARVEEVVALRKIIDLI